MNVYISLDGVIRNTIEKFEYHYNDYYLESDEIVSHEDSIYNDDFKYDINRPIKNDNLLNYFLFHSIEEFEHFLFIEFPLEIFGHAKPSYPSVFSDLNKLIYDNKNINFVIVCLDEKSKAKPASLFFLSKNNFLGNNIKFITSNNIQKEWKKCDIWITDNQKIIQQCPINKKSIKFNTIFNDYIDSELNINDLSELTTNTLLKKNKPLNKTK